MAETQARIDKMLKKSEPILQAGKPKHNDIKVPPFTDGQKKVIEATERIANGKLICDVDDDIDVLTNEDWLRTATTEQLAEFLFKMACRCSMCGDESQDAWKKVMSCPFGKTVCVKNDWKIWLKQPHTIKE